MMPLFSKGALMILESLSFTETLYAFDFDGTLSRIVRDPSDATISPKTESLLRELAARVPVAIVSGRGTDDLRARLRFEPKYLVGNHGLEGLGRDPAALERSLGACRDWRSALVRSDFGAGVEIEDMAYSLALHYRKSRNKKQARERIHSAVARLRPAPRVIPGKCVVNLLPADAPHKGLAVLELMRSSGARHAFYIGDDDTDEDVFALPDAPILTVRVGEKRASRARYFLRRQSEVNRLLRILLDHHRRKPPA